MNAEYETGHQLEKLPAALKVLLLSALPVIGMVLAGGSVWALVDAVRDGVSITCAVGWFLVCMAISAAILYLGWIFIDGGLARYRFEAEGLVVKYPLQKEKRIPWNAFQQVCVCYGGYGGDPGKIFPILCFVKKGEKEGAIHGRWKTDNPLHYKSVIVVAYTPELHEGLRQKYPGSIIDWRSSVKYRP